MTKEIVYWICAVLGTFILMARSVNFRGINTRWSKSWQVIFKYIGVISISFGVASLAKIYEYDLGNPVNLLKLVLAAFAVSFLWGWTVMKLKKKKQDVHE